MSRTTDARGLFFADWADENDNIATPPIEPAAGTTEPRHRRGVRRGLALALTGAAVVAGFALLPTAANADPSAATWYRLRMCESSDNYATNTGNAHYGAYQFDLPTWHSVGGSGLPSAASKAEQDRRALMLYRLRGWSPWQCASMLGLRADSDAGSGNLSGLGSVARHYWAFGDNSSDIARWQKQMGRRGAPLVGTGQFGPKTLAVVKQLQQQNGLPVTGHIGGPTWNLAWRGSYGSSVPAFPGTRAYRVGDRNADIARFQRQLDSRGADFDGTGQFGPKTRTAVLTLQRQNGLPQSGQLGPRTWRAAWDGRYHD